MGYTIEQAHAAKDKAKQLFRENVGVGITRVDDGYAVKVNLENPMPADESVPTSIDGVPVRIEVVGKIHKQQP